MSRKFPFEIQDLEESINRNLCANFSDGIPGFVQVGPQKWLLPNKYREEAEKLYNFPVRSDDVWIVGYPRSGTTVTQDLVWLLVGGNVEMARKTRVDDRVTFFEVNTTMNQGLEARLRKESNEKLREGLLEMIAEVASSLEKLNKRSSPRIIKSHLPLSLLPPKITNCKVVYIYRNIKDLLFSYYKLQSTPGIGREFVGTFQKYWNFLQNDLLWFNPYWSHIYEAWQRKDQLNFLFISYETLTKNLRENIQKMAQFLNADLGQEKLVEIEDFLKFDNYKKSLVVEKSKEILNFSKMGGFVRSGRIGAGKEEISREINEEMDTWIKDNLKKLGIDDDYFNNFNKT